MRSKLETCLIRPLQAASHALGCLAEIKNILPGLTRLCLGCAVLALSALAAIANEPVTPEIKDAMWFLPSGSIVFNGRLGRSLNVCENERIVKQNVADLIAPFASRQEDRTWRSEFWGKWFTSAALAYRYQPQPRLREILDEAALGLMNTQSTNGDITTYKPAAEFSNWDTWGRKYTLLGFLAYCDLTDDPKTLAAACHHADYVLDHFGPGKADIATNGYWNGMAASSILEPMVLLYRRTGDSRYLRFAEYIVHSWQEPEGPDLIRKALKGVPVFKMFPGPDPTKKGYMGGGSSKAYEMMSCYEGLIELYRVTGEREFLDAASKAFANIRDTEITIIGSGSSWERWCNGRMRQADKVPDWMETCVTVYWLKFAAQLLCVTGDPAYADQIERTTYNALLAAQKEDGTWWSHYSPLDGTREGADDQCGMHMDCCTANGPRGLMMLPELAVMNANTGPVVNFYEPADATVSLADNTSVHFEIKSDYPRFGVVNIIVNPASAAEFTLSLRIPAWSDATRVEVNGRSVSGISRGTYARLTRTWKPGDRVRLTFDFRARLVRDPGGSGQIALVRGPVVYALDNRISKPLRDENEGRFLADTNGIIETTLVHNDMPPGIYVALDMPIITREGKRSSMRFCDYASAGDTWSENSTFRVWLPQPLDLRNPLNLTNQILISPINSIPDKKQN
ncbi:MAG TPA: beta-L-arabinofuranosidase domain-containing protein [Verrucomicrobiae bacterium]|jgi:hypothetical protein|nr:beta-L-arabinofuranosidase domain-containing protein [Verrucomicrobiae bacterium]